MASVTTPITQRARALEALEAALRKSTTHTDAQVQAALKLAQSEWGTNRVFVGEVVATSQGKQPGEPYMELTSAGRPSYIWSPGIGPALEKTPIQTGQSVAVVSIPQAGGTSSYAIKPTTAYIKPTSAPRKR